VIGTLSGIGNSQGLIFDQELRELTGLDVGDQVNVTVHTLGTIIVTPLRKAATHTIHATVEDYATTLRKLS
jgi:antitoxin component of MazEF toxin-antitoxin module